MAASEAERQAPNPGSIPTPERVQFYIGQALAAGHSQASIDSFIANNGIADVGRLMSALGPPPSSAIGPLSVYKSSPYATPTPVQGTGAITQPADADGMLHAAIVPNVVGSHITPDVNVNLGAPAAGTVTLLPAAGGVPTWAIVLGAIVLVMLFYERQ